MSLRSIMLVLFILLLLLISKSDAHNECTLEEKYKIKCETVCEQDGDEKGVVIEGQCGCWNRRDIGHIPTKIGNMRGGLAKDPAPPPPVFIWEK